VILWGADGGRAWTYHDDRPGAAFRCLAFHPRGRLLAAGCGDGRLLLLDARRGEREAVLDAGAPVQAVAFSPGGTRLAAGPARGTVLVWSMDALPSPGAPKTWDTGSPLAALRFARDGEWLVTGGRTVGVWDAETGRGVWALGTANGPVRSLAVSADGAVLAAADEGDAVNWFDLSALNRRLAERGLGVPGLPNSKAP
jgi:WD40 repeat protein